MFKRALILFVAYVCLAAPASAQESRGAIIGRVMDSSGAVIPQAAVKATNVATNTTASTTTNAEGNFELPYLLPGIYRITAELTGFKRYVREDIELRVNDRLAVDITMQVGDVSQQVEVTGETPLLEVSNASLGSVVDERRASEMPIVGGSAFYLARLTTGISKTGGHGAGNPMDYGQANDVAVSGTRTNSSEVTLDGVPNMFGTDTAFSPPQDLVQEFRIQTATFDAGLGHAAGGVVNVSMKAGGNAFHGTAYLFNSRIRAVPWFSNRWFYDPTTGPLTPEKKAQANPGWNHNRWGATGGGPLYIPKLYDGHDKTFFSYGYEGLYISRQTTFTGTVPTAKERQGDLSELLAIGPQYQIYDPLTTVAASGGRFRRDPLAGNVIPAQRLDPIAQKLMGYWPMPNAPGTRDGRNNYFRITSELKHYFSNVLRLDHNLSQKHRLFGRINQGTYTVRKQDLPTIASGTVTENHSYGVTLDDVYVVSPSMVTNVRYGATYMHPSTTRFSQHFDLLSVGFPAALVNDIKTKNDPNGIAFPQITVDGSKYTDLGQGGGNGRVDFYQTAAANVSHVLGNHSLRWGGEFRLMRENGFAWGNVSPRLDFGTNYTRGPVDNSTGAPIGQGLAALLLGQPTGGKMNLNASRAEQSTFFALYVQNDWKLTRKLTVNLGVRWEYEGPTTERYNRSIRQFDFVGVNPIQDAARANYARNPIPELPVDQFKTLGGLTFAAAGGNPRGLWSGDRNNFAPRFSVAYQLPRRTVFRAGYGIFHDLLGIDRQNVNQGGFNQQTSFVATLDNGRTYIGTLRDPFPRGLELPTGAAAGLRTNLGRDVTAFNPNSVNAYMQRWSAGFQHELPHRVLMEAGYVGNRGTHIAASKAWDAVTAQYLSRLNYRDQPTIDSLSAQVANPFYGLPDFVGGAMPGTNVGRSQLLRPYPQFSGITTDLPIGYSWYHSLQIRAEKRFSRGYSFQANYTWSKFMEATGFLNESDTMPERVISDLDFPHRLVVSSIYEFPFGRRKFFGSNWSGWLDALAGGWQLQGWFEGQSGEALGFGDIFFYGDLHNIPLPKSQRKAERWFNIDAGFVTDSKLQPANHIQTISSRFNGIRGDGINNWDMSMFKNFRVGEKKKLQFRAEFFNALNHVQFGAPATGVTSSDFGSIKGEKGHGQRQVTMALKFLW